MSRTVASLFIVLGGFGQPESTEGYIHDDGGFSSESSR